jgi:type I restriction enzyme S subunit
MSEWIQCELKDIAKVQTGPFGSQLKNEQYITGGIPVVTVEHINHFRIVDFNYPSVTNKDRDRLSKYLLNEGDIVFTRVGSVDLSAYVKKHQHGWMFSSRMLRVRTNNEVGSRFLSYFFQQKRFRDFILNIAVGATMPSINTKILQSIPVSFPPPPGTKSHSLSPLLSR